MPVGTMSTMTIEIFDHEVRLLFFTEENAVKLVLTLGLVVA